MEGMDGQSNAFDVCSGSSGYDRSKYQSCARRPLSMHFDRTALKAADPLRGYHHVICTSVMAS